MVGVRMWIATNHYRMEDVWKLIWVGLAPPKVEFFAWQVIHGRVATKSELVKRTIISAAADSCSMCHAWVESVTHLFVSCDLSWQIWHRVCRLWNVNFVAPGDPKRFLLSWIGACPSCLPLTIWHLLFFAILWSIWRGRNDFIYHGKVVELEGLFEVVMIRVSAWSRALWLDYFVFMNDLIADPSKLQYTQAKNCVRKRNKWQPPSLGTLKFNVDGAVSTTSGLAGIGGILRDEKGKTRILFSKNIGLADPSLAETLAI